MQAIPTTCGGQQAKVVLDSSGISLPTDYDPRRDGEFEGPLGMLSAVAALRFGGRVLLSEQDDGSWRIQGLGGVAGRGETASLAYGDFLNRMKQEMNEDGP